MYLLPVLQGHSYSPKCLPTSLCYWPAASPCEQLGFLGAKTAVLQPYHQSLPQYLAYSKVVIDLMNEYLDHSHLVVCSYKQNSSNHRNRLTTGITPDPFLSLHPSSLGCPFSIWISTAEMTIFEFLVLVGLTVNLSAAQSYTSLDPQVEWSQICLLITVQQIPEIPLLP